MIAHVGRKLDRQLDGQLDDQLDMSQVLETLNTTHMRRTPSLSRYLYYGRLLRLLLSSSLYDISLIFISIIFKADFGGKNYKIRSTTL